MSKRVNGVLDDISHDIEREYKMTMPRRADGFYNFGFWSTVDSCSNYKQPYDQDLDGDCDAGQKEDEA
jgi:hypothetical protein